jgi:hypothetical protein
MEKLTKEYYTLTSSTFSGVLDGERIDNYYDFNIDGLHFIVFGESMGLGDVLTSYQNKKVTLKLSETSLLEYPNAKYPHLLEIEQESEDVFVITLGNQWERE